MMPSRAGSPVTRGSKARWRWTCSRAPSAGTLLTTRVLARSPADSTQCTNRRSKGCRKQRKCTVVSGRMIGLAGRRQGLSCSARVVRAGSAVLTDITLQIPRGALVAVSGGNGSGGSSLLGALAGEVRLQTGSCRLSGRAAMATQQPWLRSASVRHDSNAALPVCAPPATCTVFCRLTSPVSVDRK